ncbi:uncharacterized protein [Nicotiana sylvestris]|uniref:uncharacterized protein n=1 Tax=Nicotiana sylvestris TaxID=4096 RepID=UPI00388C7A26
MWNVRGANNADFRRNIRELVNNHNPCMVALLETKMDNHASLREDFNFSDYIENPGVGRAGGMVIMWVDTLVAVERVRQTDQELHALVRVLPNYNPWIFSSIYASNSLVNRLDLWNNLKNIFANYKGPWLMGGDFNDVLNQNEKWGGRSVNRNRSLDFRCCVNHCNLIDLGFKGTRYTWSNHRRQGLILEILDRCLANESWIEEYPSVLVTHLPNTYSDHNPLLLRLTNTRTFTKKPFRLEKYWLSHPELSKIVEKSWNNRNLNDAQAYFKDNVSEWSAQNFGNIFANKKRLLARIKGHKINNNKSKILFSGNCSTTLKDYTISLFNIKQTTQFEKYLGFPIINNRPKPLDFQFVIDNLRNKLSSWKINFLTLAGRATLAKAALNAIPNHNMQYISLLKKTLYKIDKIQRDFIWGTTATKRKIHYVSWDVVTLPKDLGGLGILKAWHKNQAILAGLAWRLFTNPSTLWANTLIQNSCNRTNIKATSFI